MITRIEGMLEAVQNGAAIVDVDGGLTYDVLVSSYTAGRLGSDIGKRITLHTLHYFDSLNQGATLIPRLAGFLTTEDRRFFELFTTCKGIGQRKALRAMTLATQQIAAAVADRDVSMLQSLPEIGKRTAETIIATLHGKVDTFVGPTGGGELSTGVGVLGKSEAASGLGTGIAREAMEVLTALGENRAQVVQWIDRVMRDEVDTPTDTQQLINRVYQLRAGRQTVS